MNKQKKNKNETKKMVNLKRKKLLLLHIVKNILLYSIKDV